MKNISKETLKEANKLWQFIASKIIAKSSSCTDEHEGFKLPSSSQMPDENTVIRTSPDTSTDSDVDLLVTADIELIDVPSIKGCLRRFPNRQIYIGTNAYLNRNGNLSRLNEIIAIPGLNLKSLEKVVTDRKDPADIFLYMQKHPDTINNDGVLLGEFFALCDSTKLTPVIDTWITEIEKKGTGVFPKGMFEPLVSKGLVLQTRITEANLKYVGILKTPSGWGRFFDGGQNIIPSKSDTAFEYKKPTVSPQG